VPGLTLLSRLDSTSEVGCPARARTHQASSVSEHGKKFNAKMLRLAEAEAFNDLW